MFTEMGLNFLKPLDSYGYKKIHCEEHFAEYARTNQVQFIAVRLADVIGPFDESFRMWKYFTWIKAHVSGDDADLCKTRLTEEQRQKVRSRPIYYETPKDDVRKLSFTFSLDVVKFILAFLSDAQTESNKINQCGEG